MFYLPQYKIDLVFAALFDFKTFDIKKKTLSALFPQLLHNRNRDNLFMVNNTFMKDDENIDFFIYISVIYSSFITYSIIRLVAMFYLHGCKAFTFLLNISSMFMFVIRVLFWGKLAFASFCFS